MLGHPKEEQCEEGCESAFPSHGLGITFVSSWLSVFTASFPCVYDCVSRCMSTKGNIFLTRWNHPICLFCSILFTTASKNISSGHLLLPIIIKNTSSFKSTPNSKLSFCQIGYIFVNLLRTRQNFLKRLFNNSLRRLLALNELLKGKMAEKTRTTISAG